MMFKAMSFPQFCQAFVVDDFMFSSSTRRLKVYLKTDSHGLPGLQESDFTEILLVVEDIQQVTLTSTHRCSNLSCFCPSNSSYLLYVTIWAEDAGIHSSPLVTPLSCTWELFDRAGSLTKAF